MDENTQSEAAQACKNAYLESYMMFWKDWNKLMPSSISNGSLPAWFLPSGTPFNVQSGSVKNSLQKITQYLIFNVNQQKIFLDWSNIWVDYLTTLAKNQRKSQANGGDQTKVVKEVLDASKELMKSFVSLMDGQMENISELYKSSCAAKKTTD